MGALPQGAVILQALAWKRSLAGQGMIERDGGGGAVPSAPLCSQKHTQRSALVTPR